MNWQTRHLRLTLGSDLHCGSLPLGFVARTHPFVPCHLPFFALVPATVAALNMPQERASFQQVEAFFEQCLRATPLYVLDGEKEEPLFPWDAQRRAVLEQRYLDSRYGVSLEWQGRSAEEGRLFETEVLLARGKACSTSTVLDGYLFFCPHAENGLRLSEDAVLTGQNGRADLQELAAAMRLGGNATRCLARPGKARLEACSGPLWGKYALSPGTRAEQDWPCLEVPANTGGPLPLAWQEGLDVEGPWAVLTGRRHGPRGAGQTMDAPRMAWREGWRATAPRRVRLRHPRVGVAA